jgi:hypothetical protein
MKAKRIEVRSAIKSVLGEDEGKNGVGEEWGQAVVRVLI